jgi:hypothetical protein
VVISRWLFNIPLMSPSRAGTYGDVHTTDLVLVAAAAALIATGIAHLLLASTPRPMAFFNWIVGLATLILVIFPFSTSAPWQQKVATAIVDLVLGVAIGSLINGVAARSIRRPPPPGPSYDPYPQWGPPGRQEYPGAPGPTRGPAR